MVQIILNRDISVSTTLLHCDRRGENKKQKIDHVDMTLSFDLHSIRSDDKPGDKLLQVYGFVHVFNSNEVICI